MCVPDLTSVAKNDTELRDLQGKVIAHCEEMADRVAVLDTPRDMSPQRALAWRVNDADYDSKQATLYYPWLEVMDPLTQIPDADSPVRACGRGVGTHRHDPGGAQGAGQRGDHGDHWPGLSGHRRRTGRAEPRRLELHPLLPGTRHQGVGRAHALVATPSGAI